jgi:hypothetical protein
MARGRFVSGYGPEVFTGEFPRFESVKLARAYPDFSHESPHNMFVDALVAQGLTGAMVLAGLCVLGLAAAFRWKQPALGAALAAGVVSQQFTAFTMPTALLFFVSLGLLVALGLPATPPRRSTLSSLGAAALGLALVYLAIRFAAADHALQQARGALEAGDLSEATSQYQAYVDARLPGGTADIWYSRALLTWATKTPNPQDRATALRQAEITGMRSTQTAEDPFNAWYNLGVICGSQEKGSCVESSLRAAIAAHPTWFKPHWTLAQVLRVQGRREEALREATLAADLDARKDADVTRTLEEIRGWQAHAESRHLQE